MEEEVARGHSVVCETVQVTGREHSFFERQEAKTHTRSRIEGVLGWLGISRSPCYRHFLVIVLRWTSGWLSLLWHVDEKERWSWSSFPRAR
jgi:hypothetical protein